MAADTTVKTFGLHGIADSAMTPSIFLSVVWVMTLGVISYPLLTALFLKKYTTGVEKLKQGGGFIQVAIPALFVGLMGPLVFPTLLNFENPAGIASVFVAGASALAMEKFAGKLGLTWMREFSFPLSMLMGMAAAIVYSNIFV